MRVKICGIQNEIELATAVNAGADMVGFQVGQLFASQTFVLPSTARRLAEVMPVGIVPVLVTHLNTAAEIGELLAHSGISTVQINNCPPEEVARLRDLMPSSGKIIYTEYVHTPTPELDMAGLLPLIDAVNLDCYNQTCEQVGIDAPNKCYAWDAGRDFIRQAQLPVIISGRLSAENIDEALSKTAPFGVDACSLLKNSEGQLDPELTAKFARKCKQWFFSKQ